MNDAKIKELFKSGTGNPKTKMELDLINVALAANGGKVLIDGIEQSNSPINDGRRSHIDKFGAERSYSIDLRHPSAFVDDFLGSSLNLTNWDIVDMPSAYAVENSFLKVTIPIDGNGGLFEWKHHYDLETLTTQLSVVLYFKQGGGARGNFRLGQWSEDSSQNEYVILVKGPTGSGEVGFKSPAIPYTILMSPFDISPVNKIEIIMTHSGSNTNIKLKIDDGQYFSKDEGSVVWTNPHFAIMDIGANSYNENDVWIDKIQQDILI